MIVLRWIIATAAFAAIITLSIWGVNTEVRWAYGGAWLLSVWAVLVCFRRYVGSESMNVPLGLLGFVVIAAGYFYTRISQSTGYLGADRDELLLLIALSSWIVGLGFGEDKLEKLGVIGGLVVVLCLHAYSIWMAAETPGWHMLSDYGFGPQGGNEDKVYGLYENHIFFGNFTGMVASGLLAFSLFAKQVKHGYRWLSGAGFLLAGFAIYQSQSRGALLVLLIISCMLGFIYLASACRLHIKVRVVLCAITTLVVLSSAFWVVENPESVKSVYDMRTDAVESALAGDDSRIMFWPGVIQQWLRAPVSGNGAQSTDWGYMEYWPDDVRLGLGRPEFAHSEYLQLLADYGVIGLILGVTILVWHLCVLLIRTRFATSALPVFLAITLFGIVHVITDFVLHLGFNVAFFAFALGGLLHTGVHSAQTKPEHHTESYARAFALPVMVVAPLMLLLLSSARYPALVSWRSAQLVIDDWDNVQVQEISELSEAYRFLSELAEDVTTEREWKDMARLAAAVEAQVDGDDAALWRERQYWYAAMAMNANADDPEALSLYSNVSLHLGRISDGRMAAKRGWLISRSRNRLYQWSLDLAALYYLNALAALEDGDLATAASALKNSESWVSTRQGRNYYRRRLGVERLRELDELHSEMQKLIIESEGHDKQ